MFARIALFALAAAMPAAAQPRRITGVVKDSLTRAELPGVEFLVGRSRSVSDRSGRYSFQVDFDTATVEIVRIGYTARRLKAAEFPDELWLIRAPQLLTELTASTAPIPIHVGRATALGVSTVDSEAVAARTPYSFADVLASLEGVSAQHPGAWGAKTFIRGLGGERITVLIDGDRVNRACNNGMDAGIATIDPSMVDRVEVIGGPGSVLYGSGNIGGVVNVVTRRASTAPIAGSFRVQASSAVPGASLGGQLSIYRPRFDLLLSADGAAYDDYRAPSGTIDGSSYRNGTVNARLAVRPRAGHQLEFRTERYLGRDIGYPAMAGAQIPREDRLLTALDYGWQASRGAFDGFSAKVYRQGLDHDMTVRMSMAMPNGSTMTTLTEALTSSVTYGARAQARLKPAAMARLDAGAEITQWRADGTRWVTRGPSTPMASTLTLRSWPDVVVTDAGLFGQGEWLFGTSVALSAGARLDAVRNRAVGTAAESQWVGSGNIGLKFYPANGLVARATLGRGYRIADPTELHGLLVRPDGFIYEGNPRLETETGRNVELGATYGAERVELGVTVFRNDLRNLISSVLVPDSLIAGYRVRQFTNLNKARIEGISGQATVRLSNLVSLRSVASYTRGENRDAAGVLPLIPPLEGQVTLKVRPARRVQWVELETRWAARQDRAAVAQGEVVSDGFAVANIRGSFRLWGADVVPGVDNILDKSYRNHLDPVRLTLPGRNFYLKMEKSF
jgi:hemoglobin/transferrin/lactoferrin receptor protein